MPLFALVSAGCADQAPAQKRSQPTAELPSVTSGVKPEEIDAVNAAFRRRAPDLQQCWNDAFEKTHDRTIQGDVSLGFTVTPSGVLKDVKVVKSSMGNADIDACVAATAAKWTFPTVSADLPYDGRIHLGAQY